MFAIVQNDTVVKVIQPHTEFELFGQSYNAKWTARMTDAEKAALGITEVVSDPVPDERFFWVTANPVALVDGVPKVTYTVVTKDLEVLKTQFIAQTKAGARAALADTDWLVIRRSDRGIEIPAEAAAERTKIVADCEAKEAAIRAATTVEELMAAV